MDVIRKSIPNSGGIKSKSIRKLLERLMSRRIEIWNNTEISTTLTLPDTVSTTARRKISNKIRRKTNVKKLINKCGCFK